MKVYDTDEAAVSAYQRKQTLAKVLMVLMMLLFSGFGIWALVQWIEPSASGAQSLPTVAAFYHQQASPAAGCVMAVPFAGVDLFGTALPLAAA
jgi:TRAP-type C4-dicarboxylate transport system permease small subunit